MRQPKVGGDSPPGCMKPQLSSDACFGTHRSAAVSLHNEQQKIRDHESHAAACGERAALPSEPLDEESAAEVLLTAEQMHSLHPTRESLQCARIEALIHCKRYKAALVACNALPRSVDAAYLTAEALWRNGCLDDAVEALRDTVQLRRSAKCAELWQFIEHLKACVSPLVCASRLQRCSKRSFITQERLDVAQGMAEINASDAAAILDELLASKRVAGTRMNAELLRRRAALTADSSRAIADLDAALRMDPDNVDCLIIRAGIFDACGDKERCFLDLRRIACLDPKVRASVTSHPSRSLKRYVNIQAPSSAAELRAAAKNALQQQGRNRRFAHPAPYCGHASSERPPPRCYQILGLSMSATERDIARAYRKLAAKWHPDRAPPENQEARPRSHESALNRRHSDTSSFRSQPSAFVY